MTIQFGWVKTPNDIDLKKSPIFKLSVYESQKDINGYFLVNRKINENLSSIFALDIHQRGDQIQGVGLLYGKSSTNNSTYVRKSKYISELPLHNLQGTIIHDTLLVRLIPVTDLEYKQLEFKCLLHGNNVQTFSGKSTTHEGEISFKKKNLSDIDNSILGFIAESDRTDIDSLKQQLYKVRNENVSETDLNMIPKVISNGTKWKVKIKVAHLRQEPLIKSKDMGLVKRNTTLIITGQSKSKETLHVQNEDVEDYWYETENKGKKVWIFGGCLYKTSN